MSWRRPGGGPSLRHDDDPYLGVWLGLGELRSSLSALTVLAVNVALILAGGSLALGG